SSWVAVEDPVRLGVRRNLPVATSPIVRADRADPVGITNQAPTGADNLPYPTDAPQRRPDGQSLRPGEGLRPSRARLTTGSPRRRVLRRPLRNRPAASRRAVSVVLVGRPRAVADITD
ncbi:MAG: hypothetical protein RLZZ153_991, partial [Pseudomonadota bacterium]